MSESNPGSAVEQLRELPKEPRKLWMNFFSHGWGAGAYSTERGAKDSPHASEALEVAVEFIEVIKKAYPKG